MLQRRKTIETDRKTKVNLPAAVFNRTFESEQNNASLCNLSSFDNLKCENHPTKKGKYSVLSEDEGEEIYYCEKCAILLASQGFKVIKLEPEQPSERKPKRKSSQNREQQLEDFLHVLDQKLQQVENLKQTNMNLAKNLNSWEDEAYEKVEMFFEEVLLMIGRQKHKYQGYIQIKKGQMEEQIDQELGLLEDQALNLHQMKEDIESSYESIVRETPEEDYNLVMNHYQKNITELKLNNNNYDSAYPLLPNLGELEGAIEELFDGENCVSQPSLSELEEY